MTFDFWGRIGYKICNGGVKLNLELGGSSVTVASSSNKQIIHPLPMTLPTTATWRRSNSPCWALENPCQSGGHIAYLLTESER